MRAGVLVLVLLIGGCAWLPWGADGLDDVGRGAFEVRGVIAVAPVGRGVRRFSFVWEREVLIDGEPLTPPTPITPPTPVNASLTLTPPNPPFDVPDGGGGVVDVVSLRSFVGVVVARVWVFDSGARLQTSSQTIVADDAETLTRRAFGVGLPLRLIGDVLGGAGDGARRFVVLRDKMRRLGWQARFEERDADGLPLRFVADGDKGSVDIRITRRR